MNNTHILCFVLGYQGGTVHQVAKELGCSTNDILYASEEMMGDLCRRAQQLQWKRGGINGQLVRHLRACVDHLLQDYAGHDIPPWLERADGVCKIVSEQYPPS